MKEENGVPLLEELVECGSCSQTMTTVHDPEYRYACPVSLRHGLDDCPTAPVAVGQLDIEAVRCG